jgi:prevent-host-death family protein
MTDEDPGIAYPRRDDDAPPSPDGRGARVGVRELRQNLSVYLRRVAAGESLVVTEHGHPIARLGPLPPGHLGVLDRLVEEGVATPATRELDDIGAPLELAGGPTLSEVLLAMRDEETR